MRVLLIEDDEALCEALSFRLNKEGFDVDVCQNGAEGLAFLEEYPYGLALLDLMLPEMDGREILARVRKKGSKVPILVLTALGAVSDRVNGLDLGADDYLVKPFALEELMARIRTVLRRPDIYQPRQVLTCQDLTYYPASKELNANGISCTLSRREGELLEYFLRNPGQTLSRPQLLDQVWGPAEVEDGNLDNYIYFLRRRLKSVKSPVTIRLVRGIGYVLEAGPG